MAIKKTAKKASAKKAPAKKAAKKASAKTAPAKTAPAKTASAPRARAKKPSAETTASAGTPLETLLARTLSAMKENPRSTGPHSARDSVDEAVAVCISAGKMEEARALARALPSQLRGTSELAIALAVGSDPGPAVTLLCEAIRSEADPGDCEDVYEAVYALDAAKQVPAALALKIRTHVDAWADAVGEPRDEEIQPHVSALLRRSDNASIRELLSHWRRGTAIPFGGRGEEWLWWADAPEGVLQAIAALDEDRRGGLLGSEHAQVCARWSLADLEKLVTLLGGAPTRVGYIAQFLVTQGRASEARLLLDRAPGEDPVTRAEQLLLVGARDEAIAVLSKAPASTHQSAAQLRVTLGLDDWSVLAQRDPATGSSVMAAVDALIRCGDVFIEKHEFATVVAVLAAIDELLALSFRTQYDRGIEVDTRSRVLDLRAALLQARGDEPGLTAALEQDLATLPELAKLASNEQRAQVTKRLVMRAVAAHRPEMALKAAKKVAASARPQVASMVARAFLPNATAALAALETLAGDEASLWLLGLEKNTVRYDVERPAILAQLFAAALA